MENAFPLVVPDDSLRILETTFGPAEASSTGGSGKRGEIYRCVTLRNREGKGEREGGRKEEEGEKASGEREKGEERGRGREGGRWRERETALKKFRESSFKTLSVLYDDEVYQQSAKGILREERDFSPGRRKKKNNNNKGGW